MKKIFKVLGTVLVASLIPYSHKKDTQTDEESYQALLWKLTKHPSLEDENKRNLELVVGFNNPFAENAAESEEEEIEDLFDDEEEIATPVPTKVTEAPETPDAPKTPEAPEAPAEA